MTYVIGIIALLIGVVLVIKTEWFVENFGTIGWAEQHLGSEGGSRLAYKIIGITAIVLSMLGMTGLLGTIIVGTFGKLFGLK